MKNLFIFCLSMICFTCLITSCSKNNDSNEEVEAFVDQSVIALETRGGLGRGGCFEIVFPVQIVLPDGSVVETESYLNLRETLRKWRKANGGFNIKPLLAIDFVYPMSVINSDGETVTLNSREELGDLRKECLSGGGGHGAPCFRLSFPLSLVYPDGTITSYDSPRALKEALREWRKNHLPSDARPVVSFPITVTLEDGSSVVVNSKEELRQLKKDCK